MPKPKYIYDDVYDEQYPADGIYDGDCRSCGRTRPIEELDEENWCKECVEKEYDPRRTQSTL